MWKFVCINAAMNNENMQMSKIWLMNWNKWFESVLNSIYRAGFVSYNTDNEQVDPELCTPYSGGTTLDLA
mgnify:CR=1 FL=1